MALAAHVPLRVFCAYARSDSKRYEALKQALAGLQRQGHIEFWSDQKITAGMFWKRVIAKNLDNADIILLLISSAFIHSDYCYNNEMRDAFARQEEDNDQVRIIPIILRSCHWEIVPSLAELQVLPPDLEPIFKKDNDADAAMADVARAIYTVVQEIVQQRAQIIPPPPPLRPLSPPRPPRPPQPPLKQPILVILCISLIFLIVGGIVFRDPIRYEISSFFQSTPTPSPNYIGHNYIEAIPIASGSENVTIGISDGGYTFDSNGNPKKDDAAKAFLSGKTDSSSWSTSFTGHKLTDGESCIYAQDQKITTPHYFTVVAAVTLSRPSDDISLSAGAGEEELQGICLQQMSYNAQPHPMQMRVLVANMGARLSPDDLQKTIPPVVGWINGIALNPANHFIGVIGLPFSTIVNVAMPLFFQDQIPVISPTASSADFDSMWSPYFHRVVSDTTEEGKYAAQMAQKLLKSKNVLSLNVLVFYKSDDTYSNTLATSFDNAVSDLTDEFGQKGQSKLVPYNQNNKNDILSNAQRLLENHNYNLVFCACFPDDFKILHGSLINTKYHYAGTIMGGEALYDLEGYQPDSKPNAHPLIPDQSYKNIYFTAFTFPDEVNILCSRDCSKEQLDFYTPQFCQNFDPNHHPCKARPGSHAMLSYDAINVLLNAYQHAPQSGKHTVSYKDVKLDSVDFQGMTGRIHFINGRSNAVNKAVLMICVDNEGHSHLLGYSSVDFLQKAPQPPHPDLPSQGDCVNVKW